MVFYFKEAKMFFFIVWFILLFRRAEHRNHVYTLLGTNIQKYRFNYNSLINQSMLSDLDECTKQSTSKTNWQSSFIFEFSRPVVQLYLLAIHQFLLSLIWIIRRINNFDSTNEMVQQPKVYFILCQGYMVTCLIIYKPLSEQILWVLGKWRKIHAAETKEVPNSGFFCSEINLAPPSLKSCIRPWLVIMSTKWKYFDYLFRCRGINPLSPPCNPISVNVGIAEFSLVAGNLLLNVVFFSYPNITN